MAESVLYFKEALSVSFLDRVSVCTFYPLSLCLLLVFLSLFYGQFVLVYPKRRQNRGRLVYPYVRTIEDVSPYAMREVGRYNNGGC